MLAEPPAAPRSGTARLAGMPPGATMRVRNAMMTAMMLVCAVSSRMDATVMVAACLGAG